MEYYFVAQITKTNDSETYATSITPKAVLNEAKSLYHQICASIYATPNIEHAIVELIDFFGVIVYKETIIPDLPEEVNE